MDMTEDISIQAKFAPFENDDVVDIILSGSYQGWTDIRRSGNRYYVQIEQGLLPSDISELEIWGYIYDEDTNSGNGGIGEERKLDSAEYTIIGAEQFNPDLPGVYTVTYVCNERPYLYLTFTITVIESQAGMA